MRRAAWLAALALAACTKAPEPAPEAKAEAPVIPWSSYVCADGRIVQALYPDAQTARVKLAGEEHRLKISVSGSGARYVGEGLQWWTKGDEAFLASLKAGEDIASAPGVSWRPA